MQNIVCLDSQIVIWGIKNQSSSGQVVMIERTREFLDQLDEKGIQVLIPTIVIAEILIPEPLDNQIKILNIITEHFIVGDLTIPIAQKFAQLFSENKDLRDLLKEQENLRKDKMKFDHIIIATALHYGASCIYSYDPHLKSFANNKIEIREIPEIHKQSTLFS